MAKKNQLEVTKEWDDYASEETKPPFVLGRGDKDPIVIEEPSGAQIMNISQAFRQGDSSAMLVCICGDAWPEVQELLPTGNIQALLNLLQDVLDHFGLSTEVVLESASGKRRTEKDPRKIKSLTSKGWTVVGEYSAIA